MDKQLVYQGAKRYYRREGDTGTPVVFLHGFAEDHTIWDHQVTFLQDHYQLIIPDLPGSGLSGPVTDQTSMESLAEYVKAVLDEEKISKCILIGHSMGGYVTLAFAGKYPDRLLALGLFHSTALPDSEEKKEFRKKSITFIRRNGAAPFIRQSTPNLFTEYSRTQRTELVNDMVTRYANFNPDSLVAWYEAMMNRIDRTAVLYNFPRPVLFIAGEQDNAVPLADVLRQSHMPSLSVIHILSHSAHLGMLEEKDHSNQLLQEFIKLTDFFNTHKILPKYE